MCAQAARVTGRHGRPTSLLPMGRGSAPTAIRLRRLVADGQWHEIRLDARVLRELYGENLQVLKSLKVQRPPNRPSKTGDGYWLDEVIIGPQL